MSDAALSVRLTTGFHTAAYPAGATYGPRRLDTFEFVWMREGEAEYIRDGVAIAAPEGSFVLCRPPAADFFRWDPRRPTHHAYFHFHLDGRLPPEWPALDDWPQVRVPETGDGDDLLSHLFRNLLAWGDADRDGAQTQFTVLCLLSAFVTGRTSPRAALSPSDDPKVPLPVRVALGYIERRLRHESPPATSPITLAEIADAASVTPEHLCRLFRAATGHSPLEAVRLRRLERARTLLLRTNYSVAEVAALCGFASPFHFSRRFKEAYGVSPREARRQ